MEGLAAVVGGLRPCVKRLARLREAAGPAVTVVIAVTVGVAVSASRPELEREPITRDSHAAVRLAEATIARELRVSAHPKSPAAGTAERTADSGKGANPPALPLPPPPAICPA